MSAQLELGGVELSPYQYVEESPQLRWITADSPAYRDIAVDRMTWENRGPPAEAVVLHKGRINHRAVEQFDCYSASVVKIEHRQTAMDLRAQALTKTERWHEDAKVRAAIATYLNETVVPAVPQRAKMHGRVADALACARTFGYYGRDALDGSFVTQFTNRAGLVKLCPADARNEAKRVADAYVPVLVAATEAGCIVRACVATIENASPGHLAAASEGCLDRIKREWLFALRADRAPARDGKPTRSFAKRLLKWSCAAPRCKGTLTLQRGGTKQRACNKCGGLRGHYKLDFGRRFPWLIGAWVCMETPLSGRYKDDPAHAWNVHANVILVFAPPPPATQVVPGSGWVVIRGQVLPDYKMLREAWGANLEFYDNEFRAAGEVEGALRELIKYPVKTVAEKSFRELDARKTKMLWTEPNIYRAPPLTEWPPELYDEWWTAWLARRRTTSYGTLFGVKTRGERRNYALCEWLGTIHVTPAGVRVSDITLQPWWEKGGIDSIMGNKFAGHSGADPPGEWGDDEEMPW